ncbi:RNA-guided endonuclease InsQ/TnpB family protein [Lusitaniella coriacea]|uniref:RNA-guided endonuclease InsQ/TnpB family protein n=1 Tax=Lusitaniella coriacea TaxID=1983105 RepID=UPI003CF1FA65
MKVRYQYRIYPTRGQQTKLAQLFGCCRVVWNDALYRCRQSEKLPKNSDLQKTCITQAKQTVEREWLTEVSNIPLQQSIADLGVAFKNFFASLKGQRQGQKVNPPRFKKKDNRQTARFRKGGFSLKGKKVYLACLGARSLASFADAGSHRKIGNLKVKWSRPLPSDPSSVTVIKDRAGRYFLSFVVEIEPEFILPLFPSVGIDLGLKTFAVLSTGEKIHSPDYAQLDRKIRRAQRRLSKRVKGSKRYQRIRLKIAKLKARQRDLRKDFLHKLSTRVIHENQVVALENLNVSGMVKNQKLSRAISQMGWREFRVMCEAKASKFNREVQVIGRWEPTSQCCSSCGYRWGKLDLSVREVVCLNCGILHDRDGNAAKNIESVGVGQTHDAKRTGRECKTKSSQLSELASERTKTPVGAVLGELSTHQKVGHLAR